ncbi:MAG: sensor domain-containing diguanylate cyclase [Spirochaetales bacterium]
MTTQDLEKEIFDLKNLLEISRSLTSTLDYHVLNDSILYTCLGALTVAKAAFFSKRTIDATDFTLHRDFLGFDIDHARTYNIAEHGDLVSFLNLHPHCHEPASLQAVLPASHDLEVLLSVDPHIVVPLKAKGAINGLLVLGEKIGGEPFNARDRDYLMNIAGLAAIAIHNAYLFEMTTTDMMTKLKLKHFFVNTLQETIRVRPPAGQVLSLVMMDIDHFKNVNDTWGHLTGDEILKGVASLVLESVRVVDTAARYGGEEFIVLLPGQPLEKARLAAERIRLRVEGHTFASRGQKVPVTISLGVAEFDPARDVTVLDFIERVDQALYSSKQSGRNRTSLAQ